MQNNERSAFVYLMASQSGTLYIGMTNDIVKRVLEHKSGINEGFTKKYHCHKLVYFKEIGDICAAIALEKKLKGWSRKKKEALIKSQNPCWFDLAGEWQM